DPTGRLEALAVPSGEERRESFAHIAIPRTTDSVRLAELEAVVRERLEDVRLVTDDFALMVARARAAAGECEGRGRTRATRAARAAPRRAERGESCAHTAIPRAPGSVRLAEREAVVRERLEDIRLFTDDFALMVARAQAAADECERLGRTRATPAAFEPSAVA